MMPLWIISASIISLSMATEIMTYSGCLVAINSLDGKRGDLCCPCLGPIQCASGPTTIYVENGEAIIAWFPEDSSSKATYPNCIRVFKWPKLWPKVYFDENWCLRDRTYGDYVPNTDTGEDRQCCHIRYPPKGPMFYNPFYLPKGTFQFPIGSYPTPRLQPAPDLSPSPLPLEDDN